MDFSGHSKSASYPVHQQELSPNNEDHHPYYLNNQTQFAISSSVSQESTTHDQQGGYVYPDVNNVPLINNDVGLHPLSYTLPHDYMPQMEAFGTGLPYLGESHQTRYDYDEAAGGTDQYQLSHEYDQSQHYYNNAGGQHWL